MMTKQQKQYHKWSLYGCFSKS